MRLSAFFLAATALLSGCEMTPRYVDSSAEFDQYIAKARFKSACVALDMNENDQLRQYAAERLSEYVQMPEVEECLCVGLYTPGETSHDRAIAKGLVNSGNDRMAECLGKAYDTPEFRDPLDVVADMGALHATKGYDILGTWAKGEGVTFPTGQLDGTASPEQIRAQAAGRLRPSDAHVEVLTSILANDSSAEVRTAAAEALADRKQKGVVDALLVAVKSDADGGVRAAAMKGVAKRATSEVDEIICNAMLEDEDPRVRTAAIKVWQGTKRDRALACLRQRAFKEDDSGAVREALLKTLGASPSDEATDILCDMVGPWLRMYVTDKMAFDVTGGDVMKAQNDRDWERSFECAARAKNTPGLSCYARNYLGGWIRELGGSSSMPCCPGMDCQRQ